MRMNLQDIIKKKSRYNKNSQFLTFPVSISAVTELPWTLYNIYKNGENKGIWKLKPKMQLISEEQPIN